MALFDKKKRVVWIVREFTIDTFGSYTSSGETLSCHETKEQALEYIEFCARTFEETQTMIGHDYKKIRLADDPDCKILISRRFEQDCYPIICEYRLLLDKKVI